MCACYESLFGSAIYGYDDVDGVDDVIEERRTSEI